MPVVIALLITASLLVFVAYPLLAGEEASAHLSTLPVDVTPQVDLKNRRLVLYENMRDLEFEYQAGRSPRRIMKRSARNTPPMQPA